MKTLKIKDNSIELEQQTAICNFCGNKKEKCIKSYKSIEYETLNPYAYKTEYFLNAGDWGYETFGYKGFFGDNTYTIKVLKREPILESFYPINALKLEKSHTYICHDCIRQLAKLIK